MDALLFAQIAVAPLFALLVLALPNRLRVAQEALGVLGAVANFALVLASMGREHALSVPWVHTGLDFALRLDLGASVVTVAAGVFGLLVAVYSVPFMRGRSYLSAHYGFLLLTLGFVNGAVLANSLFVLLFFWEGLLASLWVLIAIGREGAWRTAGKALTIAGVTDLCLMLGVALVYREAGTVEMSAIRLPVDGVAGVAFVLLVIGAVSKAGSMPFHSWLPDAAVDAPVPFMAFLPASVEKLLGLYLLGRVTLDLFVVEPGSWASHLLIGVGAVGLVLGGLFALVQRDLKRLLVLQSVSQAGLMILAIGTAAPLAIAGAMFQLLNHVTYKTCLFFAAGAVERQAGSTDLYALGALRKRMPITFVCFLVASASMAGLPPLAGFFSKELVYDGLLESGYPLYAVALVGSFLTVAAVLRVGHAVFFGEQSESSSAAKEAPAAMLAPMVFLAGVAALFGLANALPVQRFVLPMLPERVIAELHGHHLTGWPANAFLVIVTAAVVLGAIVNHAFGAHLNAVGPAGEPGAKGGAHAAEHVERAPVLGWLFTKAAEGRLDPYELFMRAATLTGRGAARVHAGVDWVYVFAGKLAAWCSTGVRLAHTGNTSSYVVWSLLGAALVLSMLFGWS